MYNVVDIAKNAKEASVSALKLSSEDKNNALRIIVDLLNQNKSKILDANKLDLDNAKTLLKRLNSVNITKEQLEKIINEWERILWKDKKL